MMIVNKNVANSLFIDVMVISQLLIKNSWLS
ncbi:hypothetical protein cce_2562 [Crocosphaera subtropica ATCC 51142]|uniref:Uncharacterized protein n=1 Tax=Crocosphaera subtropica (strain ATCC 51142 / BH68) TaxID=43989 RepID=B1WSC4_CROS5|nr:hypothetical protein cce_2562 [Crocosphaera subtropica ATCC 51142]